MKSKNVGTLDRLLRVVLAEICIIAGIFWASLEWQIILFLLSVVLLVQAATGVCGFYSMLRWNTCENVKRNNKNLVRASLALILIVAVVGSYASSVLTGNIFMTDFGSVKKPYDLTLNYTAKDLRQESIGSYEQLTADFAAFENKYANYRPFAIMFDSRFTGDMQNISVIINSSGEDIHSGSLTKAHDNLAKAGPIFDSMLRRSGLAESS